MDDPLTCVSPPNQKFGEVYCNYVGVLSFQCVFCPTKIDHSDEFRLHITLNHFQDVFPIKQEQEEVHLFESHIGISDLEPEQIKDEYPQSSNLSICETKSESKHSDDNYPSSDQSCSEDVNIRRQIKRGRPKGSGGSTKFTEPKTCGICGQTFEIKKSFKNHIRIHVAGPLPSIYECDVCGRKATKMKNLIDHFRYKHTRKIKCEICKKMVRRNYIIAHTKRHNNERNYKCMLCDKAFVMAGDLTTHLKLHYSPTHSKVPSSKKFVEPQSCAVCCQKFIGISAFERHIQSHGPTSSLYECDICGRKVREKKNLLSHMLFRHSKLPKVKAPCTICGKLFNRKYLNLHVRKHNMFDQKPSHMCPICGKTFLVSGDLSAHIRQHNRSVEAAPCSVCGKTFASPASLADHQRVHTGEKPFSCQICNSKFRTRSMLYVHRTIHLTEKNFACDICDMKFKNPAYVKTHKRKVHEKNRMPKKMRDFDLRAAVLKQFEYDKPTFNV